MHIYVYKKTKKFQIKESSAGFIAFISTLISGLFASATCIACVSVLFAFIGTGGMIFLLEYRWQIVIISFMIVLLALYFTSKRIQDNCEICKI